MRRVGRNLLFLHSLKVSPMQKFLAALAFVLASSAPPASRRTKLQQPAFDQSASRQMRRAHSGRVYHDKRPYRARQGR